MTVNLLLERGGVPTLPRFSPPSSSWFAVSDGFYSGPISQAPRDSIASFPAFAARCKYGNTGGGKGLETRLGKQSKWSETGCRDSSGMYRNKKWNHGILEVVFPLVSISCFSISPVLWIFPHFQSLAVNDGFYSGFISQAAWDSSQPLLPQVFAT